MESATATCPASIDAPSAPKLTEKVFEIKAVDEQASSLLDAVNEINGQLDAAKALRRQNSQLLSSAEKRLIDGTFQNTERALTDTASLVELRRVPVRANNGDFGTTTGLVFVLRDSPQIILSLGQLGLASQSLQTALNILCRRDDLAQSASTQSLSDAIPPPTYEESQFLTESRTRNMLRRASSNSVLGIEAHPLVGLPSRNLESLVEREEHGVQEGTTGHSSAFRSPISVREILSLEAAKVCSQHSPCFQRYIPYKPGLSSPSMSSLDSQASTPNVLMPATPRADPCSINVVAETRISSEEQFHSTPLHEQNASEMRQEALRQGAQSPALSVVDGFVETQQRMASRPSLDAKRNVLSYNTIHRPQLSDYGLPSWIVAQGVASRQDDVALAQRQATRSSLGSEPAHPSQPEACPQGRRSPPTVLANESSHLQALPCPTTLSQAPKSRSDDLTQSSPTESGTTVDVSSKQLELPRHVTAHEPALSMSDLQVESGGATPLPHSHSPRTIRRDWESLPSQLRCGRATSKFVFTCESPELAPTPLFHNILKLDASTDTAETIQQMPVSLARKPVPTSPKSAPEPLLESEFPEVVLKARSPQTPLPLSPGSELPELVLEDNGASAPEPVTVVTEVSTNLLERTRTQRQLNAQRHLQGDGSSNLAALSPSAQAPELSTFVPGSHTKKKPPPVPLKPRRAPKSSSVSSLPTLIAPLVPEERNSPGRSNVISGRARSQRWRELQFERSQLLPNSLS